MADPKINKCDPSLNLTCDELFKNGCISAEENESCDNAWHTEISDDSFVSNETKKSTTTSSIKLNPLFSTSSESIDDEVCFEDDDLSYYEAMDQMTCEEESDSKIFELKNTEQLDALLKLIGKSLSKTYSSHFK